MILGLWSVTALCGICRLCTTWTALLPHVQLWRARRPPAASEGSSLQREQILVHFRHLHATMEFRLHQRSYSWYYAIQEATSDDCEIHICEVLPRADHKSANEKVKQLNSLTWPWPRLSLAKPFVVVQPNTQHLTRFVKQEWTDLHLLSQKDDHSLELVHNLHSLYLQGTHTQFKMTWEFTHIHTNKEI